MGTLISTLTFGVTLSERISFVISNTSTNSSMNGNSALSVDTTSAWTRIQTLLIDTSLSGWTFSVQDTFRFAGKQGVTNVVVHAFADWSAIQDLAKGV